RISILPPIPLPCPRLSAPRDRASEIPGRSLQADREAKRAAAANEENVRRSECPAFRRSVDRGSIPEDRRVADRASQKTLPAGCRRARTLQRFVLSEVSRCAR